MKPPFAFPGRAPDAHKNAVGDALVIAGARGMTGAALLCARSCLRGGAGLVTIACPESVQQALDAKVVCEMTRGLPETPEGSLSMDALEPLLGLCARRDAIALGPGLSQVADTANLVRYFVRVFLGGLESGQGPRLVLDADGLNAFAGQKELLKPLAGRAVLTPHPGEFRRLTGADPGDREAALEAFVRETGVVTLLKGHRTLVYGLTGGGDLRRYQNETGNPGMATAGAGDVLTGLILALLAQGLSPYEAACLGAWLHGRAGDVVARRVGQAPLIASDLIDGLIEVIRDLEADQGATGVGA
ncbi:MAG: NAD(P)H-hydrate dehydratase [Planctomycetota bacterium]